MNRIIADKQTTGGLPRIEIRPVVFHGTYNEKNWQVLHDRWNDLRAQLHGIVISSRIAEKYSNAEELVAEINDAAPNFSPSVQVCKDGLPCSRVVTTIEIVKRISGDST